MLIVIGVTQKLRFEDKDMASYLTLVNTGTGDSLDILVDEGQLSAVVALLEGEDGSEQKTQPEVHEGGDTFSPEGVSVHQI